MKIRIDKVSRIPQRHNCAPLAAATALGCCVLLVLNPTPTVAQEQKEKGPSSGLWRTNDRHQVRLEGDHLKFEPRTKLSFWETSSRSKPESLFDDPGANELPFSIPLKDIVVLIDETQTAEPVREYLRQVPQDFGELYSKYDCADAAEAAGACVILSPFLVTAEAGIAQPFRGVKRHHHVVHIIWGADRSELKLPMKAGVARDLLAALGMSTGKTPATLDLAEAQKTHSESISVVQLGKFTMVGNFGLFGGKYVVAHVEDDQGIGMIYLFDKERSSLSEAVAYAPIRVTPLGSKKPQQVVVEYSQGYNRISEIHLSDKSLSLLAPRD